MIAALSNAVEILKRHSIEVNDPWDIVDGFEALVADYAGSNYAVAVDSCTNAMFLSLRYLGASGEITIPKRTYLSVPQLIIHAGCKPKFVEKEWSGIYKLAPFPVIDGATRFRKDMYIKDTYHCLSFHIRKILPIAKGGMILLNDKKAYDWLKLASYEGRDRRVPHDQMPEPTICGWNMYMPPEQAARGIELFDKVKLHNDDCGGSYKYADISNYKIFL